MLKTCDLQIVTPVVACNYFLLELSNIHLTMICFSHCFKNYDSLSFSEIAIIISSNDVVPDRKQNCKYMPNGVIWG